MKDRTFLLAVAFSVVALMPLVPTAQAAGRPECLVSNERTGQGSRSLQNGIDAASSGDALVVKGTCVGNSTITKDLQIKGVSNPAFGRATLDGDGLGTVLTITDVITVAINDLTIANGSANEGGGIFNWYGSVTLADSVVSGNRAPTGGGISNRYGAVAVTDSTLIGNAGISGGGIFTGGGTITLTGTSAITNNDPDNCYPPSSITGCTN